MKMTKREIIILVSEVACVFLPSIIARVLLTLIKNYVRNSNDTRLDENVKIQPCGTKNVQPICYNKSVKRGK